MKNQQNIFQAKVNQAVRVFILICMAIIMAACQGAAAQAPQQTSTPGRTLSPAASTSTLTATQTPSLTHTATFRPTQTARPSATPTQTALPGMVYHKAGRVTVPILLYHNINDDANTRYIVRSGDFYRQMSALHEAGFETVTISDVAKVIREGGYLPEKPVVITFDDGFLGVYENAFPIMRELGFKGVVYLISGTLGTDKSYGYMQSAALKEMITAGWEMGSHSISHSSLKNTRFGIGNEIKGSKNDLEEKLSVKIQSFSYPYNITNDSIKDLVADSGYDSAVGVDIYISHAPERLYFLSRREVLRNTTLNDFRALLIPGNYEIAAGTHAADKPSP